MAAGAFDLTIAGTLTVSVCFTAWALTNGHGVVGLDAQAHAARLGVRLHQCGRFGDHADSHMGGIQLKLPL